MKNLESLNRVELVGVIGRVTKTSLTEKTCVRMSVCTTAVHLDKNGNQLNETQWFTVSTWMKSDDEHIDKLTKGAVVRVKGRLCNMLYTTEDGTDRVICEVVAHDVECLGEAGSLKPESI